jgi:hypothetical protein
MTSPLSTSGRIRPCTGGLDGPCAVPIATTRKDNPVWEGCAVTSIKTDLKLDGELSIVTVTIGVKNSGKKPVTDFLIPIQPTTAAICFGTGAEPFDILGLRFPTIEPGAEVHAKGEFKTLGAPKALWVAVQL